MIMIEMTLEDLQDQNPEDAMDDIHQEKEKITLCGGVNARNAQTKTIDLDKKNKQFHFI